MRPPAAPTTRVAANCLGRDPRRTPRAVKQTRASEESGVLVTSRLKSFFLISSFVSALASLFHFFARTHFSIFLIGLHSRASPARASSFRHDAPYRFLIFASPAASSSSAIFLVESFAMDSN